MIPLPRNQRGLARSYATGLDGLNAFSLSTLELAAMALTPYHHEKA
jgi:hypothetical protein